MAFRKRNKGKRKVNTDNTESYLQTTPNSEDLAGVKHSRQNPRNLPTENASMHQDAANEILGEADSRINPPEESERGE
jgi:hypothetical protein